MNGIAVWGFSHVVGGYPQPTEYVESGDGGDGIVLFVSWECVCFVMHGVVVFECSITDGILPVVVAEATVV